jgi:hypothetical protein
MPELLKNVYSPLFFEQFTTVLKEVLPKFRKQHFLNQIFDSEWGTKELKQRMRHIAMTLKDHLPVSYKEQVGYIIQLIELKVVLNTCFCPILLNNTGLKT